MFCNKILLFYWTNIGHNPVFKLEVQCVYCLLMIWNLKANIPIYLSHQYSTNVLNHGQTIYPTEYFISLNLFKILYRHFFLPPPMAVKGQKHPSVAKNVMKELIYLKKFLNKSCLTTSKTPWQVQSDLSYDFW